MPILSLTELELAAHQAVSIGRMQARKEEGVIAMQLVLEHNLPTQDLGVGVVAAIGVSAEPTPPRLRRALQQWVQKRQNAPLSPHEETLRRGSRDMLRHGKYKPTGRGKPASEYLLRAAREGDFPHLWAPVDANNLVSVRYCVPISLWDLDLAGTDRFELRYGLPDESYVFNRVGQTLSLTDLVCGCGVGPDRVSTPLVTPIKDSARTKLTERSTKVGACVYYPLAAGDASELQQATDELGGWLAECGARVEVATALCLPGEKVTLHVMCSGA